MQTGYSDKYGRPICDGDTVERYGHLKTARRFVVFMDKDGEWRLDESGNMAALVYPPLVWERFRPEDHEVVQCTRDELKAWNGIAQDEALKKARSSAF